MTDLLKTLSQHFDQDAIQAMSRQIGASTEQTHGAINAALPVLVGMLARNNRSEDGGQALARAVERDHDGSILDQLQGFFSSGETSMGERILGHVLGSRQTTAEAGLAERTGLSGGQIHQLLALLAPVVMGALGRQSGGRSGGLGDLLEGSMGELLQGRGGEAGASVLGDLLGGKDRDLGGLARAGSSLLGGLFRK
ncbi:DUF937 domain-containing protein [Wenzhouxiangella marina]|uniref:Uncharacterized protein n=1 Tax=Wenzhouxiangella marina TaxID=1579979 RepID=A0A0K0XXJ2_9GAMM|nr:DUF937 domain-containing protein [Wenzhouxiangella marina]AKS42403.1 hypothetical protein WM2015_2038 [Wenzhouxiangella marina]MBB6085823.1 hypothetical protein [Wenzhouxiangella marina]